MEPELGTWEALRPEAVAEVLAGLGRPWWIGGGWALDLFLGCETRPHRDVDVVLLRGDEAALARHLNGWDIHVAWRGALTRWDGRELGEPNALWVRRAEIEPWLFDVKLEANEGDDWIYRRNAAIRCPIANIGVDADIPYLRPEIVLLYKAAHDEHGDVERMLPHLDKGARAWLEGALTR